MAVVKHLQIRGRWVLGSTPPSDSCVCEESITEKGDVCYMNRVCVFETVREMKGMIQRGRDR